MKVNINANSIGSIVNAEHAQIDWGRRAKSSAEPPASPDDKPFDVFVTYNSEDRHLATPIATALAERQLRVWVDYKQVAPGDWFQRHIERAIGEVKAAVVVIGPSGIGRWQRIEVEAFTNQCVDRGLRVIPVLTRGVDDVPGDFLFLKNLSLVRLEAHAREEDAIEEIVRGIRAPKAS